MEAANEASGSSLIRGITTLAYSTVTLVAGVVALMGGLLYVKQESLLYLPEIGGIPRRPEHNPRRYRSPGEHGIPFQSHMIQCSDGVVINAWFLDRGQPNKPTLVFFHGNAGNIGLRLPNAIQMYQYLDANILLVEYRGYGDSDSVKPNESGLKLDAEASLRFLSEKSQVDPKKVFIFGRSLGGAVAFHLAQYAEKNAIPLAGVIVENTFTGIPEMVDHLMPYVAPLKMLILRMGWESILIVPHLKTPILYLAGSLDEIVPHSHMLRLHKASKSSRISRIHIVRDGTHNETWLQGGVEYWNKIKQFIADACMQEKQCDDGQALSTNFKELNEDSKSIPTMSNNIIGMLTKDTVASSGDTIGYDPKTKKEM